MAKKQSTSEITGAYERLYKAIKHKGDTRAVDAVRRAEDEWHGMQKLFEKEEVLMKDILGKWKSLQNATAFSLQSLASLLASDGSDSIYDGLIPSLSKKSSRAYSSRPSSDSTSDSESSSDSSSSETSSDTDTTSSDTSSSDSDSDSSEQEKKTKINTGAKKSSRANINSNSSSSSSESGADSDSSFGASRAIVKSVTHQMSKAASTTSPSSPASRESPSSATSSSSDSDSSEGSTDSGSDDYLRPGNEEPPAKRRKTEKNGGGVKSVEPVTPEVEKATEEEMGQKTIVNGLSGPVTANGSATRAASTSLVGKDGRREKQPRKSNAHFQRIKGDAVKFADERLKDNSFHSRGAKAGDYGERAHADLIVTRGDSFRKEKNKKKRGSYRGGEITLESHSIKFT